MTRAGHYAFEVSHQLPVRKGLSCPIADELASFHRLQRQCLASLSPLQIAYMFWA